MAKTRTKVSDKERELAATAKLKKPPPTKRPTVQKMPEPKPIIGERIEYSDHTEEFVYEAANGSKYTFPRKYLANGEIAALHNGDLSEAHLIAATWAARMELERAALPEGARPDIPGSQWPAEDDDGE